MKASFVAEDGFTAWGSRELIGTDPDLARMRRRINRSASSFDFAQDSPTAIAG